MKKTTSDPTIERLFLDWLRITNNANAAATLTAFQLSSPIAPVSDALSVKQAAKQLGVSKETVYKLCDEHALDHTRIGRRITISSMQLEQFRTRPGHRSAA